MDNSSNKAEKEGFSKVIANHYNNLKNCGYDQRNESKIICMRNFNNWLKSMIINEFVDLARENPEANPTNIKVLDIGCGKGGDLRKYSVCDIKHLVCTDIAEASLEECKKRYESMKNENNYRNRNKDLFTCEIISADATKDDLKAKLNNPYIKFDLTIIQFAYHYSFETIEQACKLFENASNNLRNGGYLVGTTVNANKVMKNTLNQKKLSFGNDIFSIKFPEKALDYEKMPIFGNTYNFHLHDAVDCPEFLVHFPTVVHLAKKYNLELCYHKRFEDYYLEKINEKNDKNISLLNKMRALKTYPLDEEEKLNFTEEKIYKEFEKAHNFCKNSDLVLNDYKKVGTMSKSEWEAITLYIVFAFKKISPKKN